MPPIPGVAQAGASTNREATTSNVVPQRLLGLGGGVVDEVWVRLLGLRTAVGGAAVAASCNLPAGLRRAAAGLRHQKLQPMR